MNVDDPILITPDQLRRYHHQKSRQHHQIRPGLLDPVQKRFVELLSVFVIPGRHADRINAGLSGPLQGTGIPVVADHTHNLHVADRPLSDPVNDRL